MYDDLIRAGMSAEAAASRAAMFERAAEPLADREGLCRFWVPGRIEIRGNHVDYGGGRSLVAAIERGFCVVAAPREDTRLRVTDVAGGQNVTVDFNPELELPEGWRRYVATVARRLARDLRSPLVGLDVCFVSDLPPAAGMSSSSALLIALFLAIARINRLNERDPFRRRTPDPLMLADYIACIENGQPFGPLAGDSGVGTFGGSQDHAAILCCRANTISQFAYCPLRYERDIPMPAGQIFVVAASGVEAIKTGPAMELYNRAADRLRELLRLWNEHSGRSDTNMMGVANGDPATGRSFLKILTGDRRPLYDRFAQFYTEAAENVPTAGHALLQGDFDLFRRVTDCSQQLAEYFLGNQIPETIFLACAARENGANAASAFGAGFGGSVWAMISENQADDFTDRWRRAYLTAFPQQATSAMFFTTRPGPPAFELTSLP